MPRLSDSYRSTWLTAGVLPLILAACSASAIPASQVPADRANPSHGSASATAPDLGGAGPISLSTTSSGATDGSVATAAGSTPRQATQPVPATPSPQVAAPAAATATPRVIVGPVPSIHPISQPVAPGGGPPRITPIHVGPVACTVFPSLNVWNKPVDGLSVASNSSTMIQAIGQSRYVHADFDAIGDGIPYNVVTAATPTYSVSFDYADESDPGPYPIPANPLIENGSDAHLLSVDMSRCKLWELYAVSKSGSSWSAGSGAVFDLRSNALRPAGWTSADAAGLPIYAGLVRYDEVTSGSINHALRFTASSTCGYIYPATHLTAQPCSNLPPMGLRVRLKASVNISSFGPNARVVLTALKKYGMILADNGSPWYISGAPDTRWNDDEFHALQNLHGSDFEVVDTSGLRNG